MTCARERVPVGIIVNLRYASQNQLILYFYFIICHHFGCCTQPVRNIADEKKETKKFHKNQLCELWLLKCTAMPTTPDYI